MKHIVFLTFFLSCVSCFDSQVNSTEIRNKSIGRNQNVVTEIQLDTDLTSHKARPLCKMPFRYVVVNKWIKSSESWELSVFMDPEAFSVENLRLLFSHLSGKNPGPKLLTIKVSTDWSQLEAPDECEGSGASGETVRSQENYDHHRAEYYRRGGNIYFYYTLELHTEKMEKVVVAGNHQPKQRWE